MEAETATKSMKTWKTRPLASNLLDNPSYKPGALLDSIQARKGLKNDAAIARALEVEQPVISKVRSRRLPVTDALLVRMHDNLGLGIPEIRRMMGVAQS